MGCTRGGTPHAAPSSTAPSAPLQAGDALFSFDYETVTDFLIVKADPDNGDRWAARLSRPDARPGSDNDWELQADGNPPPLDHRADGYFVLHLLDTLRTLRVEQAAVPGPHESLGLAPPHFALQWKAGGREYEVRFGATAEGGKSAYAWVPGQSAFTVSGATLQMLGYVTSLTQLRLKTWAGISADDVDEISIGAGAGTYYAQREGADWNDRAHHAAKGDVGAWLERLTHLRIQKFVDDPARAAALSTQVRASRTAATTTLKDRRGRAIELRLARIGGAWIGVSSARPQGVFELYPEAARALEPPGRKRK